MRHYEERDIDGHRYICQQLPARKAFVLLADVGKVIGPALASAIEDGTEGLASLIDKDAGLGGIASALFGNLDTDLVMSIIDRLCDATDLVTDGKKKRLTPSLIDLHFQGRMMSMFKWLKFCLEVQYRDFFQETTGLAAELGAAME